jgi:hypothetical protein
MATKGPDKPWLLKKHSSIIKVHLKLKPKLHVASALGIVPWVNEIIAHKPSTSNLGNARDEMNLSPLHLATHRGHILAIRFLLENGAEVDEFSVFNAASEGHTELLEMLLEKGGNVNA